MNTTSGGIRLYGVDGNMANSLGAIFKTPGVLSGMTGTTPLTPLSDDFKARIRAIDPNVNTLVYAGESYDAVVITALAVQLARTTDPQAVAKYINGVTTIAPGGAECGSIKKCLEAITAGQDVAYRGVSVHGGFTDAGEPSTTSYGTLHFGQDNRIDDGKTEFVAAGSDADASKKPAPAPAPAPAPTSGTGRARDALRLGILFPRSGGLAEMGPGMFAAAHLAIKEINDLGGVLGRPITFEDADDGTNPVKAGVALDKLIQNGIGIIIGPSTSGESTTLIPRAVATGRILFSPSATAASLTKADDHGMFFRTAPSDINQSQALADVIMRGGARRVFIIARADEYGTGMRDGITDDLVKAGVKKLDIDGLTYRDNQRDYSEIVQAVKAFHPDSVVLAGYQESAQIIEEMLRAGLQFSR